MRNILLTSDQHFGHKNIIRYCNRPFDCVEEMNEILVQNWNETVTNNDVIYHLGDFMMGLSIKRPEESYKKLVEMVGRLRGTIRLISGNHDKTLIKLCKKMNACPFEIIKNEEFIRYHGRKIFLSHRATAKNYSFHGHSHGNLNSRGYRRLDIGVDCHKFSPITIEKAISLLDKIKIRYH